MTTILYYVRVIGSFSEGDERMNSFSRRGFLKILASVVPVSVFAVKSVKATSDFNPTWWQSQHMFDHTEDIAKYEHTRTMAVYNGDIIHGYNYPPRRLGMTRSQITKEVLASQKRFLGLISLF